MRKWGPAGLGQCPSCAQSCVTQAAKHSIESREHHKEWVGELMGAWGSMPFLRSNLTHPKLHQHHQAIWHMQHLLPCCSSHMFAAAGVAATPTRPLCSAVLHWGCALCQHTSCIVLTLGVLGYMHAHRIHLARKIETMTSSTTAALCVVQLKPTAVSSANHHMRSQASNCIAVLCKLHHHTQL